MQYTDDEFLDAFQACTLPPQAFDHAGHLRISWILLRRLPFDAAVESICNGILNYATHLGAAGKFHRTITEALLCILRARGAADPACGWERFIALNHDLVEDAKSILLRHYSEERLAAADARTRFLEPDREPLPDRHEIPT